MNSEVTTASDGQSDEAKYSLHREMVDPRFREPFIMKGYRKPNMKAIDCLRSTLVYNCNETINVWTHFLAFLLFTVKFWKLFTQELSLDDAFIWPLLSFAIGIMGFCLMSSIAHTFNSISPTIRNTCFFLDYAAIGIYSVGVGQAFYFYTRTLDTSLFLYRTPKLFGIISITISISSTVLCCMTRHNWHSLKYLIRTSSFVLPFLVNAFPYLHRLVFCRTGFDCDFRPLPLFLTHCVYYLLAAVANVTRLPERLVPGIFDRLGQSHRLMHIFTAYGAGIQFDAIKMDMLNRKSMLLKELVQPEATNTVVLMLLAIVINIAIALYFGVVTSNSPYNLHKERSKIARK